MLKLKKISKESYDEPKLGGTYLPTVSLDTKQVPEIKDWEVGETYHVVLAIKQTSKSQNESNGNKTTSAYFEVTGYKVLDHEMSDDDLETMQGEALKK